MRESSFKIGGALDNFIFLLRMRVVRDRLKKISGSSPKILLDFGCGYNAHFLSRVVKLLPFTSKAVGVDLVVNDDFHSEAITLLAGDLNKRLSFPDEKFDLVFSMAVLEHLEKYDVALVEMHRVLKTGGYLFLTTPSPRAKPILEFLSDLGLIDQKEIRDHKHYFSRAELEDFLDGIGYAEVRVEPFQFGLNTIAVCRK